MALLIELSAQFIDFLIEFSTERISPVATASYTPPRTDQEQTIHWIDRAKT